MEGGRDADSQRDNMTTITMMTTNKNVMLGSVVGMVERLGSVGVGSEDEATEESVHVKELGVGACKSVSVDAEGFKSNSYTTINAKRRRDDK